MNPERFQLKPERVQVMPVSPEKLPPEDGHCVRLWDVHRMLSEWQEASNEETDSRVPAA
jgi:hypothetical protein